MNELGIVEQLLAWVVVTKFIVDNIAWVVLLP